MFKKKITIGIISLEDPTDRNISSGTNYKIVETLKQNGAEIVWLHPYHSWLWKLLEKAFRHILGLFSSKTFMFRHTCLGALLESQTIKRKNIERCNIIFASFSSPACYKLSIPKDKPFFYLSDALWHAMLGYYIENPDIFSKYDGDKIENFVLKHADIILAPSKWMKESAIRYYHQPLNKICDINFGANIDENDIIFNKFKRRETLDLLFIGVDWKRKGGKIAIDATQWLNENGIKTKLHIIGGKDIDAQSLKCNSIDYIGMLNKNIPKDYKRFTKEIEQDQVLIFPTQAECAGIVICEANAFGLPVYGTNTGGVSSYITDGVNGRLLPINSGGKEFGRRIQQDLLSGELDKMSVLARRRYEEDLNWKSFGDKISEIINEYL